MQSTRLDTKRHEEEQPISTGTMQFTVRIAAGFQNQGGRGQGTMERAVLSDGTALFNAGGPVSIGDWQNGDFYMKEHF